MLSDSVCEHVGAVADGDFSGLGALRSFSGTGRGVLTFGSCPVF